MRPYVNKLARINSRLPHEAPVSRLFKLLTKASAPYSSLFRVVTYSLTQIMMNRAKALLTGEFLHYLLIGLLEWLRSKKRQ